MAGENGTWLARLRYVLTNEENKHEVGKYNAGQKVVFWSMSILIIVLICTGIVVWDQYFYPLTSIQQKRSAVLVHSLAAVTIICACGSYTSMRQSGCAARSAP